MTIATHYRACHLCEATCGVEIKEKNGAIVSIRGDEMDPFSRGYICPKATALQDIHTDPDRLRKPVKRVGNEWMEISWEEALDTVVDRIHATKTANGNNSVGIYFGNPSVHNWGMVTHPQYFLRYLKSRNRYSATSVDQLPNQLVAHWMYGHQLLVPIPDIDRTRYFLIIGGNPLTSNGSLMTAPDIRHRMNAIQQRGGKIVVIDPRYTETAQVADQHVFVKPGTDAALIFAMINLLFAEDRIQPGRLQHALHGLDQVREIMQPFTAECVAAFTGIAADTIQQLARDFAAADGAVAYGRMGVCTQRYGSLCQWGVQLLNILTGNLDCEGGSMFTLPAVDLIKEPGGRPGHYAAWHSRVRKLPEFSGELPVAALAEEILTPGEGQIRTMITAAGNPVLSTPNGRQLDEALGSLEFMVSVDMYINETTRHANIILPPTSPLEHDHYDMLLNTFAVRNVAKYSQAVFEKPEGSLHDWEIFVELGKRMAKKEGKDFPAPAIPPPEQTLNTDLIEGPYGAMQGHVEQLDFEKLRQNPHGIDLGPLQPCLPERLQHADKKIQLAPAILISDLAALKQEINSDSHTLRLIGRRHIRSNNSWMHNYHRLVKGKARCSLLMNTLDMANRGLIDGETVRVTSRVGSIEVVVSASAEVMPGVVSLPHGWGHRYATRTRIANEHAGVSANDLTDDQYIDVISGNAALNGVAVEVVRA